MTDQTTSLSTDAQTIADLTARLEKLEGSQASPSADKLAKLRFIRSEDQSEWSLLSNRLSSYITSQSFLVSAYTISMGNGNPKWGDRFTLVFPLLLAAVGVLVTVFAYPGITSASEVIQLWHKKQSRLYLLNPEEADKDPSAAQYDPAMDDFRDGRPMQHARDAEGLPVDVVHSKGLRYALVAPWIFGVTWVLLAALTLFLHLSSKP
jgi:hypothetical protein